MAAPGQPTREFSPETQARRERKAERDARFKAAALEAMDVGKPRTRIKDSLEAGTDLALAKSTAAVEVGRPLKPSERRKVRRETLEAQAGNQPAGQAQRRRPTIDEYLERLTERQRDELEQSQWFESLDERHQADVRRRLAALEEIEEAAELEHAVWLEQQALANIEAGDAEGRQEQGPLAEGADWPADMSAEERQAVLDVAAANAEPYYSDDVEDGYGIEEDE